MFSTTFLKTAQQCNGKFFLALFLQNQTIFLKQFCTDTIFSKTRKKRKKNSVFLNYCFFLKIWGTWLFFSIYSEFQGRKIISILFRKRFPGTSKGSPGNFLDDSKTIILRGIISLKCMIILLWKQYIHFIKIFVTDIRWGIEAGIF